MSEKAKILIVDDNPNNRLAIRTILKGVDADLHEADNGFDALSMAIETEYALILLDVQMPEMDGYEVCEQLRADPGTADTPVIFLTAAYKENSDKMRGYTAGATDYLTKPLDDHVLKAKVHVFLRLYWQYQMLQENNAALRLAASVFESQQGIIITNADNIIIRANKAFTEVTGYSLEDALGKSPSLLQSGRHDKDFYRIMWSSLRNTGTWQGEIWNRRKNGEIYPEWLTITSVKDNNGDITHYIGMLTDITEYKTAEEQIRQLAFYDPLTGLPNRRLLLERLHHATDMRSRDGKLMAVMMLDLDNFKPVNDSLGHLAGDMLLQQVAKRLLERLRNVDMIARLGGDEFTVLLEVIDNADDAAYIAENIIADLRKPFYLIHEHEHEQEVYIGVSIGISLYGQHGTTPQLLMDRADTALYKAKDNGRNCFAYFSEELTIAACQRIELETRLRLAIERNEFRVFYQAKVDIATDKIIGAEALVRWQCPIDGLIAPDRFIPLTEQSGLIIPIGAWVLRETCRQGKLWLEAGLPPLQLAVNVSPVQFQRSDMLNLVTNALNETGFPAEQLELELTESCLINNDKTQLTLDILSGLGVRIAIDDFGTGYSSLAYLKHFPINTLKIDKSFVDDIPDHQNNMEIIGTIIAMGRILGFKVLAEGVETPEQLAFLKAKGCDSYQGYIKSKPVPAETFAELLLKQQSFTIKRSTS
ncbi:MAG: EAL domain-containing protein [Methylobacter sp.]|jgi:diguanylate cyclase (GGDEF)-like protein/PAS domain S-box-containing protein|nr:EAL domain-containing protein [Methylobacter sp.]